MRIVFCLFADSIGLLPEHVFRDLVRFHRTRPKKFRRKLTDLFEAMSSPDPDERYFGEHDILYFNGGLFNDSSTIELNEGDMGILYDAAKDLDWAHIEPAIFGTLFERSLDADKRSLIGAHYTSSADILLLIEPVVMQPLRRRWTEVKQQITDALGTETGSTRQQGEALTTGIETRFPSNAASAAKRDKGLSANAASAAGIETRFPSNAASAAGTETRFALNAASAAGIDKGLSANAASAAGIDKGLSANAALAAEIDTQPKSGAASAAEVATGPVPHLYPQLLCKEDGVSNSTKPQQEGRVSYKAAKDTRPLLSSLRARGQAEDLLTAWLDELTAVTVLDPTCGSGNFLYIALQQLLDLWKEAKDFALAKGLAVVRQGRVSPRQLFGIETDFYAHELASMVVWIGYLQWMHQHGEPITNEPILERLDNIEKGDAILRYDADGKPYEPTWPKADYIVGNPPFLGGKLLRRELGDRYVEDLFAVYKAQVKAESDLVVYWFHKALQQLIVESVSRAGLLATQAIRGGANRDVLSRIADSANIFFAVSDRKWILAGAAVHISVVAFDRGDETDIWLDGQTVAEIHPNLTAGANTTSALPLRENRNLCYMGVTRIGDFQMEPPVAKKMLGMALNVNGRPNSDVVKPWINATDLTRRNRGMYIIDFGVSMSQADAAKYEAPFEYLRAHVFPERAKNRREEYANRWWIFGEPRSAFRNAMKAKQRYIATPMVSKHRVFVWCNRETVAENLINVIARDDDYFFGVLHTKVHEVWSLRMGTQLEDRPRYTPNSTFDTFPFPWPPGKEPADDQRVQAIAAAANNLVELRDRWLNPPDALEADLKKRTLTNLYNAKPQWLQDAHRTLDEAVFAAYGWPTNLTDQQILERLLTLNHERIGDTNGL